MTHVTPSQNPFAKFTAAARWQALPVALAASSLVISLVLTVRLSVQLSAGGAVAIAVSIGCIWEAAKYLFASSGWHMMRSHHFHERLTGAVLALVAGVLMLGSMWASVAYMSSTDEAALRTAKQEQESRTALAQSIRRELASLEAAMESYADMSHSVAAAQQEDVARGFRARAATWAESAAQVTAQRSASSRRVDTLRAELASLQAAPPMLSATGVPGVRGSAYIVIAVVLELISVLSLATVYRGGAGAPKAAGEHNAALRQIASGKIRPTYASLRSELDVSQQEAGDILALAESQGVLRRKEGGRGWELARPA